MFNKKISITSILNNKLNYKNNNNNNNKIKINITKLTKYYQIIS